MAEQPQVGPKRKPPGERHICGVGCHVCERRHAEVSFIETSSQQKYHRDRGRQMSTVFFDYFQVFLLSPIVELLAEALLLKLCLI